MLKDFPYVSSIRSFGGRSGRSTPAQSPTPTTENDEWIDEKRLQEEERRREKKRKRKKAEVYVSLLFLPRAPSINEYLHQITRHVAQIIQRQEFILKLTRAMMMFGAPSHRLQSQIQATARVLDVELSCMYLPDVVLISFDDSSTGTSHIKFIRQGSSLDLGKLTDAYLLYWKVCVSQTGSSTGVDELSGHPR